MRLRCHIDAATYNDVVLTMTSINIRGICSTTLEAGRKLIYCCMWHIDDEPCGSRFVSANTRQRNADLQSGLVCCGTGRLPWKRLRSNQNKQRQFAAHVTSFPGVGSGTAIRIRSVRGGSKTWNRPVHRNILSKPRGVENNWTSLQFLFHGHCSFVRHTGSRIGAAYYHAV